MKAKQSDPNEVMAAVRRRTERQLALRALLGDAPDGPTIVLHVELARLIAFDEQLEAGDQALEREPR